VTYGLLVLLTIVFLLGTARFTRKEYVSHILNWGFLADSRFGVGLLTHQFIHGDFWHLLGNGIFLLAFGSAVELKLGHAAVVVVYLISGVTGAWAFGMTASPITIPVSATESFQFIPPLIGASGAIAGFIGCLMPSVPTLRIRILVGFRFHWRVYPVEAWIVCILYVLKEFFWHLLLAGQGGVAYMAHVGGATGGVIVGALVIPKLGLLAIPSAAPAAEPAEAPSPSGSKPVPVLRSRRSRRPRCAVEPTPQVETPTPEPASPPPPPPPPESRVFKTSMGDVQPRQDLSAVSGVWARDWRHAEIQQKLTKARAMEKRSSHAQRAFDFYNTLLNDKTVAAGHGLYCGWRICVMLHRAGKQKMYMALAKKLLANRLPPEFDRAIRQTAALAQAALKERNVR